MLKNDKKESDFSYMKTQIESKNEYVNDIKTLSTAQLLEQLERQNRVIKSIVLCKLPDKGEKVKKLKSIIEFELDRRNKNLDIGDAFSNLSIREKNVDILEWGEKNIRPQKENIEQNDESIEDQNPFAILATHSGTNYNNKKLEFETKEEPLVTLADIEEAYALNLCSKIDKAEPKKKYLPHRTLISNKKLNSKVRDLSAATPPLPVFGDTKLISLEESLKLQYEQTNHLKEIQIRHATERLKESRIKTAHSLPPADSIKIYRDNVAHYNEEGSDGENENEE